MKYAFSLGLLVAGAACTNSLGGGDEGGLTEDDIIGIKQCGPIPQDPMRRLTATEYRNSIRDLLPSVQLPALSYVTDTTQNGFDNDASSLAPSSQLISAVQSETLAVAKAAAAARGSLLPCDESEGAACGHAWIEDFASRAFRRPITEAEAETLGAIFDKYLASQGFANAFTLTTQAILLSPAFLYRVEKDTVKATSYDVASRLSYFLWSSMPDAELFAAARDNQLTTDEDVAVQVDRMIADPRALDGFMNFASQWLDLARVDLVNPDGDLEWNDTVREALKDESRQFLSELVYKNGGTLRDFLTTNKVYVGPETAQFYGVPAPNDWTEMEVPNRAGFFTQARFLAATGLPYQPSPVRRGGYILKNLLCVDLGVLPQGVSQEIPPVDPNAPDTNRTTYDPLRTASACGSCHNVINPIGYMFEHYDQYGRYRTQDNGFPVDASGEYGADSFANAAEFMSFAADSDQVQACVSLKALIYATGGVNVSDDACLPSDIQSDLKANGSLKNMMVSIAKHPRFAGVGAAR